MTPNIIERMAILDYRIERLHALIESGHRHGLAVRDLEQALSMCVANRTTLAGDEQGLATLLAASSRRRAEATTQDAAREA